MAKKDETQVIIPDGVKISPKRLRFCQEYLLDSNASKAAVRAGYAPKSAGEQGHLLLAIPAVKQVIDANIQAFGQKVGATVMRVLQEMVRLAMADTRQLFNADGSMKPVNEWDDDIAAAVASIEVEEMFAGRGEERKQIGYVKKVRLWDKNKPLEMLGKYLKMFVEQVQFPGKDGQPQEFGRTLTDLERATRFVAFIRMAEERKKIAEKPRGEEGDE